LFTIGKSSKKVNHRSIDIEVLNLMQNLAIALVYVILEDLSDFSHLVTLRPFLTTWFAPGVEFAPRDELGPQ
jgi:hypothetical protein